jgi:hypothetical protein
MKPQIYISLLLILFVTNAYASQDCHEEAKNAIEDCTTIAQSAEQANSDVASGMAAQPANMAHGGGNLADTSSWGRENLSKASAQCNQDFAACKQACGEAYSEATDPSLQSQINENVKTCQKLISAQNDRLAAGQTQLASATTDSRNSAMHSGDSAYRDQQIDRAQYDGGNVQKTGYSSLDDMNHGGDRIIHIETNNLGNQIVTVSHGTTGVEIGTWHLGPNGQQR